VGNDTNPPLRPFQALNTDRPGDPVFRSLELIENRIYEKLTIDNLADAVYFSKYHYQRLFHQIVGETVMDYVMKRKLTLAGRRLVETDAAIIDIAVEYGYDSREGFSRSFKAYMGVSPSEYRKYGLTAISKKNISNMSKEWSIMSYSKTTDNIIRELNEFVAKARETAVNARKCEVSGMVPFWNLIADKTDTLADGIRLTTMRVSNIAEHPDEITNRFAIIKAIEDTAYELNIILLNVNLTVARSLPQHVGQQRPLCDQYKELASNSILKARKIIEFLNELATLVFADIRKNAADKVQAAIHAGRAAADKIIGYDYIKNEIVHLTDELAAKPLDEITMDWLEDNLYKMHIISFIAETDILRNPPDKINFDGIAAFESSLREASEFFATFVREEDPISEERDNKKFLMDVVYQGNIMLFLLYGEIEKLGKEQIGNKSLLDDEQKTGFILICDKVNEFIRLAHKNQDEMVLKTVVDMLYAIKVEMAVQADMLGEYGGAIRYLGGEFGLLGDVVARYFG